MVSDRPLTTGVITLLAERMKRLARMLTNAPARHASKTSASAWEAVAPVDITAPAVVMIET